MKLSDKTLEQVKENRALIESENWLKIWETLKNSELNGAFVELGYNPLSGLKQVPQGYFSGSSVKSIEIPNSVKSIRYQAFSSCKSLTSIEIPDSVTSIGYSAFSNCSNLTSVIIGGSVISIDSYAFSNCHSLNEVEFRGTAERWGKIKKSSWNTGSNIKRVICTDGVIEL